MRLLISLFCALVFVPLMGAVATAETGAPCSGPHCPGAPFTVAMIPDTQNMLDYTHQKGVVHGEGEGEKTFPIDASEQFLGMMRYIASNTAANGGDIVFATSVGDVWQHQTELLDEGHGRRGFAHNPRSLIALSGEVHFSEQTRQFEMPLAREGYRLLAATDTPFAVAPGNHDYDAMWADVSFPGDPSRFGELRGMDADILGMLHIGGLDNFRTVFGENSEFFRDKPWYAGSFNGGANAAQQFTGGGHNFLHISLEMSPADEVLAWAQSVIDRFPGLPTIITTHDYLDNHGERRANPVIDLARMDPEHHNSAEQMYQKLIYPNDQVFLVLCGHHHGQALRVDKNRAGNSVYQILADFQDRGQSVLDASPGLKNRFGRYYGVGDGWLRLLTFDLGADTPVLRVATYSSHYRTRSSDLETYSAWYRAHEQPDMSDEEFHAADEFTLELRDFRGRFSAAARAH